MLLNVTRRREYRFNINEIYDILTSQASPPLSLRLEAGDLLVSVRVQALTEMAAKLPGGYE